MPYAEQLPQWDLNSRLDLDLSDSYMPLYEFIEETMRVLGTDADEVLVERARPVRNNAGPNEAAFVNQFNDMMVYP